MIAKEKLVIYQTRKAHQPQPDISPQESEVSEKIVLEADDLSIHYGKQQAVNQVSLKIPQRRISAIIGPSGCGKSTLLRCFNRMNDFIRDVRTEGSVRFYNHDIYSKNTDAVEVRRRIGMVFQKPNPFPKSIYKNVAWGPSINRMRSHLAERVERSLKAAALWDEVKDRLNESALSLSGGQQQRLCIARALAMDPEVILMDEPCSALDPVSTARIEELMLELKKRYTIVIVTHNMQQASRVSDYTAFFEAGRLVEYGMTDQIFNRPANQRTRDYIAGRFG